MSLLELSKMDILLWILSVIFYFIVYIPLFKDKFLNVNKFYISIIIDITLMFVPVINIAYILFKMGNNKKKYNFKNVYNFYKNYINKTIQNVYNI